MTHFLGESTDYASNYNERVFQGIRMGAPKGEVLSKLGPPLRITGDKNEYWHYSNQKTANDNFKIRILRFDDSGKVCHKEAGLYVD